MSDAPQTISVQQLADRLAGPMPPKVIDVRLEDDFACGHIPGACSNCVYEVAFGGRLDGLAPDRAAAVVVYGAGEGSHEAAMAAEKLLRAGYADVSVLPGGIAEWVAAARPLEGSRQPAVDPPLPAGRFGIDLDASRIEWTGRNLLNRHSGTVQIRSGYLEFDRGQLTGGEFAIDLTTLRCIDLAGDPTHDVLIAHLESDDFFDTARWPEAQMVITSAGETGGGRPGSRNLHVRGDLTIRGITHPVDFPAAAGLTPTGKPAAQAVLSIDRTRWNILYGSGRYFHRLAGHLVNDTVDFDIRIVCG